MSLLPVDADDHPSPFKDNTGAAVAVQLEVDGSLPVTVVAGGSGGGTSTKGNKGVPVAVSVQTTATLLLAANAGRKSCTIANNGTVAVYLGRDNTVTVANGLPLGAGASAEDDTSVDAWYAITASGACDVRVVEVS